MAKSKAKVILKENEYCDIHLTRPAIGAGDPEKYFIRVWFDGLTEMHRKAD